MTELVCPAAVPIASGPHGREAAVCGILELDSRKVDRILEGAPVGVLVSSANDPSTFYGFCAGDEPPPPDVDAAYVRAQEHERARIPRSYACCPIWAAAGEWDLLSRLYALTSPGGDPEAEGVTVGAEDPSDAEIRTFLGDRG